MKTPTTAEIAPSLQAAKRACLRYWLDHAPAIRRVRSEQGFLYLTPKGRRITDKRTLERIRKLAIPPAWSDVRICPSPAGHLQATGRDARGRKQYRYHERWSAVRGETRFHRVIGFATALPRIRRRVRRDLKLAGLPRDKVLATVVRLLETTLIRVGNEEYARENHSFGLTTLRNQHARIRHNQVCFQFRGKSGIQHQIALRDGQVARIVKRCQEIPGQELFQYLDEDGQRHPIDSADVNEYLRVSAGGEYTAKDFRTWGATLLAARAFQELPPADSAAKAKRNLASAIEVVSRQLGNTAAVCRKCYIHSAIIDTYLDGSFSMTLGPPPKNAVNQAGSKLTQEEVALLQWLQKRQNSDVCDQEA